VSRHYGIVDRAAFRRLELGCLAFSLLTGCSSGAQTTQPDPGGALAQVRAQIDGQRQCAPLLSGSWPIELSANALAGSRVDALVAAGLIKRQLIAGASEDRARVRIVLTPVGKRDVWLRQLDASMPAEPLLCYGRKHVLAMRPADGTGGSEVAGASEADGADAGNTLRYEYRIVQSPSWTARPDIRTAFPFLERELNRSRVAGGNVTFSDGKWSLEAQSGSNASADLPSNEGFFPR